MKIFYGIIDNECKIVDLNDNLNNLREPRDDECIFTCRVDEGCITISFSEKTGLGFEWTPRHGEVIRNCLTLSKLPNLTNATNV